MEQKEERIRAVALSYYSRKDVLNAIFDFSAYREISPQYFESFGKRPDSFQYPSDILSLAKKGATSFHCSEELWDGPMQLSTDLNPEKLNNLRKGWDLIIDIDCKWFFYSKKVAQAVIKTLEKNKLKNIGVKFSGNKGLHIIVPWQAFPEEFNGLKTKDQFPEWPRIIISYIMEKSRQTLADMIIGTKDDFLKVQGFTGIKCKNCSNIALKKYKIELRCPRCFNPPYIEIFKSSTKEYKEKKCPYCSSTLKEIFNTIFYSCDRCNINSLDSPDSFDKEISEDIFKILGLDLQLVSSRHLFRMPYSLHEKTSLASVVIDKNKVDEFEPKDANPLNIKVYDFLPKAEIDEAKILLFNALDWHSMQSKDRRLFEKDSSNHQEKKQFEQIKLTSGELKQEYFPPAINKILAGMEDGRKRSLFILLNFFKSLGQSMTDIEKRVNGWNQLNKPPLKQGYINSQLIWHARQKSILPPNFDNPIYKDLGIFEMDDLSNKVKNPVAYVIKKSGAWKKLSNNSNNSNNPNLDKIEKQKIKRHRRKKGELYEIEIR